MGVQKDTSGIKQVNGFENWVGVSGEQKMVVGTSSWLIWLWLVHSYNIGIQLIKIT